jgi:hypothetical protein
MRRIPQDGVQVWAKDLRQTADSMGCMLAPLQEKMNSFGEAL